MDEMEWSLEDILSEFRDENPEHSETGDSEWEYPDREYAEEAEYAADADPGEYFAEDPQPPQPPETEKLYEEEVQPMDEISNIEQAASSRRRKVREEFPESPAVPQEPFVDNFDYSNFFRMFADDPTESALTEENREEIQTAVTEALEEEKASAIAGPERSEDDPLLTEDSTDFRDILRDFMLRDQHPIYDDTPGIGSRPGETGELDLDLNSGLGLDLGLGPNPGQNPKLVQVEDLLTEETEKSSDPLAADADVDSGRDDLVEEEEAPQPRKRKKREYTVREDFPPAPGEEGPASEAPDLETEGEPEPGSADEGQQAGKSSEEVKAGSGDRKRPLSMLLGKFGRRDRKTAGKEKEKSRKKAGHLPAEQTEESRLSDEAPQDDSVSLSDYDFTGESDESDDELLYEGDFPSFGQWILNELLNLWIRLNGVAGRESTATMDENSEDLGAEVNVANASRYYGSQVTMLRMRLQIGLFLLAVMAYISLGFPVSGMLKTVKVSSAMCLGLQLTVMLLCLDVVTNAAVNLTRGKFGADGLAVLSCVISSLDALAVTVGGFGTPHIPLCLFSSMALLGILLSDLLSARALRKSIRVPAIGRRAYCVTAEERVRNNKDITILKSLRPTAGFVRRAEEAPPDETLFSRAAVFELAAAVLLSLLTGLVRHSMKDLLYILSALLSCSVPLTALLCFALPYFIGSQRIFSSGAAVAGWSGIHDIGSSRNLIVTDRDLFPEDTVAIDTVRIFADESAERIIAYAGTMIAASGSGLGPAFGDLMERNGCRMRNVEDFQWLSGGGLQGRIEGHRVLCGNSDVMQLMNVKIPYRLVDRTTVLLAIDNVLYGIFHISYTGLPEVRSALQELIASNRHPIFAIRDFNITPDMLRETFDVATDGYDFPPYGDRFRISEAQPSETSKVAAVVCREGLGPLTHLADTGRSMYVAVRINLMVTAATAVLGMLLVFVKLIGTGLLSAWLPLVLMLLSLLITSLVSVFMRF